MRNRGAWNEEQGDDGGNDTRCDERNNEEDTNRDGIFMVREGDGGVLEREGVSGAIDSGECAANGCGASGMVLVRA
jgi:hypothetical protein